MSPEQKRKFNTAAGGGFLAIGLFAWGLTAYFAFTPNPPKPVPVAAASKIDLASCRSLLTNLGYSASVVGAEVTAFEELGTDPRHQLERASLATTACKLPLKSFCMGEGCERTGINLTLGGESTPAKPATPAATSPAPANK